MGVIDGETFRTRKAAITRTRALAQTGVALLAIVAGGALAVRTLSAGPVERTVVLRGQPAAVAVDTRTGHVFVTYAGNNTLDTFDATTLALVHTVVLAQPPGPLAVDASPQSGGSGEYAFVLTQGGDGVSVLDAGSGRVVRSVATGAGSVGMPALAVDGATGHVFVSDDDGVSVLDGRSGTMLRHIPIGVTPGGVAAVAVDARTGHAFVVNRGDGTVTMLDARSGTALRTTYVGYNPMALAVDQRANRAFVLNASDNSMSVLDTRSGALLRTVPMDPGPLAVDEGTGHVFIASATINSGSSVVHVVDVRSGRTLSTTSIDSYPISMAVDTRTGRVFVATGNGVRVLDARSGARLRSLANGVTISAMAVDDAAGRAFAVGQVGDGTVAALPGSGGSVFDAWASQARHLLPWLPRAPVPTPLPSGTGLLSILDASA